MTIGPKEIICKSALNDLRKSRLPYDWDLNIYRGCGHKCCYCFALYTHDYLSGKGSGGFYDRIYVKTNIAEQLERVLAKPSWRGEIINIGGVTDSYQPAEEVCCLMPDILRLLIKYKNPCIISTKSDLILRDFELIDRLSSLTYVNIAATITTVDEALRSRLEPGGVSTARRFAMLKEFAKTQAGRGLHIMPIIPYLTDTDENLNALYALGEEARVSYALPGLLNLHGPTRASFFAFLRKEYPHLTPVFEKLYQNGRLNPRYSKAFYRRLSVIKRSHSLSADYMPPKFPLRDDDGQQLSLFYH